MATNSVHHDTDVAWVLTWKHSIHLAGTYELHRRESAGFAIGSRMTRNPAGPWPVSGRRTPCILQPRNCDGSALL